MLWAFGCAFVSTSHHPVGQPDLQHSIATWRKGLIKPTILFVDWGIDRSVAPGIHGCHCGARAPAAFAGSSTGACSRESNRVRAHGQKKPPAHAEVFALRRCALVASALASTLASAVIPVALVLDARFLHEFRRARRSTEWRAYGREPRRGGRWQVATAASAVGGGDSRGHGAAAGRSGGGPPRVLL